MSKRKKRRLSSRPSPAKAPATLVREPVVAPPPSPAPATPAGPTVSTRTVPRWSIIVVFAVLFLITRLVNLETYPLHGDEATYIYWGQIAASGPEQRFISMWGGRQPLHTWIVAALVPFVDSILAPARLISVVAGTLTALGVFLLARKLFSMRAACVATLLYILSPYTTQFDRQVFQDGMISAEAIGTLYLTVLTFERPRWPASIGLGIVIGLALLTKSTSWLFIPLIIFGFLAFPRSEWKSRSIRAAPHLLVALAMGSALYYFLFGSSPAAADLGRWASVFTYSIGELLGFPFDAWGNNLGLIARWLVTYLTLPIFLALLASLGAMLAWLTRPDAQARANQATDQPTRTYGRKLLLVAIWSIVPTLAHVILAKGLYARYIVFVMPPLLILVAALIDYIATRLAHQPAFSHVKPPHLLAGLVALLIAVPAYQTAMLVFAPQNFNFDVADRDPYYDRALWARVPLAQHLRDTASGQPVTLLTNFGMDAVLIGETVSLPYNGQSIRLSPLWPVENGKVYPFDPYTLQPYSPEEIEVMRRERVLYASAPGQEASMSAFITPLADFRDRAGDVQYRLYSIDFERYLAWLSQ